MRKALGMVLPALFAALLACTKDEMPTVVRVIIDSDLEIGAELTRLEVRVFDSTGHVELRRQDFALSQTKAPARFILPLSFRLAPESQRSTRDFLLVVTGVGPLGEGGSEIEVVEQQALASFRPGETLRLDMFLAKACLLELCRQNGGRSELSCDVATGNCQEVPQRGQLPVARGDGIDDYEEAKWDAGSVDTLDRGPPAAEGSDADDVLPDDAPVAPDRAAPGAGIVQVDQQCGQEGEKACGGNNSIDALECNLGRWSLRTICDANQRCDTREGPMRGICRDIPLPCVGASSGQVVCDGTRKLTCGDDLTDYVAEDCGANQHCAAGDPVECVCNDGLEREGAGCFPVPADCTPGACLNAGICVDESNGYRCECSGTGFQGTACETDVNECAAPARACLSEYPCFNLVGSFLCRGQQATWPMPDSWVGARTQPKYHVAEGSPSVEDSVTRLVWQRRVPGAFPGCSGTLTTECTMDEAMKYCENLELDGYSDWSLPTKIELESILDDAAAREGGRAINESVFPATPGAWFWSASYSLTKAFGWVIHFASGVVDSMLPIGMGKVRCVRRPGSPPIAGIEHYTPSSDDSTIKDNWTGLVWQRKGSASPLSWTDARVYCPEGFRLPTRKELLTLVDPSREDPAIDVALFPATRSDGFWSAPDGPSGRYMVNFFWGNSFAMAENSHYYVRCVK